MDQLPTGDSRRGSAAGAVSGRGVVLDFIARGAGLHLGAGQVGQKGRRCRHDWGRARLGTEGVARLASLGLTLPERWRWEQDSPRRGLVVRPLLGTPHRDVLAWLLQAGVLLTKVPLTGEWLATVYSDPSSS